MLPRFEPTLRWTKKGCYRSNAIERTDQALNCIDNWDVMTKTARRYDETCFWLRERWFNHHNWWSMTGLMKLPLVAHPNFNRRCAPASATSMPRWSVGLWPSPPDSKSLRTARLTRLRYVYTYKFNLRQVNFLIIREKRHNTTSTSTRNEMEWF